jgi:hypothetical protein
MVYGGTTISTEEGAAGLRAQKGNWPVAGTLLLQKFRRLQIQGGQGEAVFTYCESWPTQEVRSPRLSRRVKNRPISTLSQDLTLGELQIYNQRFIKGSLLFVKPSCYASGVTPPNIKIDLVEG